MSHTVFVTAPKLASAGVDLLEEAGCQILYLRNADDPREVERIMASHQIDAVISRTVELSAGAIGACRGLKVVSKHGVGVNNIDVDACSARGVPVFVTPGANAQSVAEMTIALLLAAARSVPWMDSEMRAGRWSRLQNGLELKGRRIGLAGFGEVGHRVARVCLALGMTVRAFDPNLGAHSPMPDVEMAGDLDSLISGSDVLSLHVPLTEETRGMIDGRRLAMLPPDGLLINTARGEVVDEPALIAALKQRRLHAAGLDTMAVEPLPADSPLLSLPNVVLAPHVGGSTPAALAAMASAAARNVLAWLDGGPIDDAACVNPEVLQRPERASGRGRR